MAKVLFVMTATSFWTLKNGTRHPTGYWAEEFAAPYSALSGVGHEVVVANVEGDVGCGFELDRSWHEEGMKRCP